MRFRLSAVATIALALAVGSFALPALADTHVTGEDGSFTADFPLPPQHSADHSAPGEAVQYSSHIYIAKDDRRFFVVASVVYGRDVSDVGRELDLNLTNYLKETGASVTSSRHIEVTTAAGKKVPALEFAAADAGRKHQGIFIMPDLRRVYTAVAVVSGDAVDAAMQKFVASLKIKE
jgi:hypothetical protein